MGYVLKPIPPEVWLSLTPEQRMALYKSERARLVRIYQRQGGDMMAGPGAIVCCGMLMVLVFLWLAFAATAGML